MAFVPESVSISKNTSRFLRRNVLFPASVIASSRRSIGGRLSF
jgi:hypothetical protein